MPFVALFCLLLLQPSNIVFAALFESVTMEAGDDLLIRCDPSGRGENLYTSGDIVRGHVRSQHRLAMPLSCLSVHLKGEVESRAPIYNDRQSHVAKGILFDLSTDLQSPEGPSNGPHSWGFQFEFPWQCLIAQQPKPFGPHPNFEHLPGYPLPPSFSSSQNHQRVSYYLEVVGIRGRSLDVREIRIRHPLRFSPSRPTETPLGECFSRTLQCIRRSNQLDPHLAVQSKSLSDRTREFFTGPPPKPTARFTVRSRVPYQGCPGDAFPIQLGFQHEEGSAIHQAPLVTLARLEATIDIFTFARVPYNTLYDDDGTLHNYVDRQRTTQSVYSKYSNVPVFDGMQLEEIFKGFVLPFDLVPSFRTYNLSRSYGVTVTATLHCIGQNYELALSKDNGAMDFKILPNLYRARPAGEDQDRRNDDCFDQRTSLQLEQMDIEALPPYEEAPPVYEEAVSGERVESCSWSSDQLISRNHGQISAST